MRIINNGVNTVLTLKNEYGEIENKQILIIGKCLSGDCLIKTPRKYFILDNLPIHKPFFIKSYNFNEHKEEIDTARKIYSGKKEVFEVETESGERIKASKDHVFFVEDNSEIIEKKLEELREGDNLILLKRFDKCYYCNKNIKINKHKKSSKHLFCNRKCYNLYRNEFHPRIGIGFPHIIFSDKDKSYMRHLYLNQYSIAKIAKIFQVSTQTIKKNIPKDVIFRSNIEQIRISTKSPERNSQISKKLKGRKRSSQHCLNISKSKTIFTILTKDFLINEYINHKKPCHTIAKEIGCNTQTVNNKLIKFGIPLRKLSDYEGYWKGKKNERLREMNLRNNPAKRSEVRIRISKAQKIIYSDPIKRQRLIQQGRIIAIKNKGKTYEEIMGSKERAEKRRSRFVGKNSPMYGKTHSEETRRIIREMRQRTILPKRDTKIEVKIQNFLKQLNIDFLTHQYIKNIEHGYQCDILIPSMNLVIECDGDYWHGNSNVFPCRKFSERILRQKERDKLRTEELISKGYKVIRLWEQEIKEMTLDSFHEKLNKILNNEN